MRQMYIHFSALPVTGLFIYNGVQYQKCSSTTARAVEYSSVRDYFNHKDLCIVGEYHSLCGNTQPHAAV